MKKNPCILNLLKLIFLLQNNSTNPCQLEDGCKKPYLGPNINNICYNTRVISIYKKNGEIFTANYTNQTETLSSSFFRIMSIDNSCVKLLILENNDNNYISTNQFITIDIHCICAIRCIADTNVTNI